METPLRPLLAVLLPSCAWPAEAPRESADAARGEFLDAAFAKAMLEEPVRAAFCAETSRDDASCPGALATATPVILYERTRARFKK